MRVLCYYEYYDKSESPRFDRGPFYDAVMIDVPRSSDILSEFEARMIGRREGHGDYAVGSKPIIWRMISYLTYSGEESF